MKKNNKWSPFILVAVIALAILSFRSSNGVYHGPGVNYQSQLMYSNAPHKLGVYGNYSRRGHMQGRQR